MPLEQKTKNSEIIQVTSLQKLRETLSKIEAAAREVNGIGGKILFNGEARVGAWSDRRADISSLSTWFKGNALLTIKPYSECAGQCAQAFDYKVALQKVPEAYSRFRYYLIDSQTPPWKTDNFYSDAITLTELVNVPNFPEVHGILLWVNEPKKESTRPQRDTLIRT